MSNKETFSTQDINIAAFIWSQDNCEFECLRPKKDNSSSKIVFNFVFKVDSLSNVRKLVTEYQNEKTMVNPSKFVQKQNFLRDQMRLASELKVRND